MTAFPGLSKQSWPRYSERDAFYGNPRGTDGNVNPEWQRENIITVTLPWKCTTGQRVQVHRKVSESFLRWTTAYWDYIGRDQSIIDKHHLNECDGGFAPRSVRGSSSISNHYYGAAVDFAAAENPLGDPQDHTIPTEFYEAAQAEGWSLGGLYSGRKDWMHVEATSLNQGSIDGAANDDLPLDIGSQGPRVAQVQKIVGTGQDGIYGNGTADAVGTWQAAHGLNADRIVGTVTWAAMGLSAPGLPTKPAPPKPPAQPSQTQGGPSQPPIIIPPGGTPFDRVFQDIIATLARGGLFAGFQAGKSDLRAKLVATKAALNASLDACIANLDDLNITVSQPPPVVVPPIVPPPGPPPAIPPTASSTLSAATISAIEALVASSSIASYHWSGRGVAPIGYTKGVFVTFGLVCQKYKSGDTAVKVMAQANTKDDDRDALSWFNSNFKSLGMSNDAPGLDTLRHLFVLLLGLGMRESSGNCFEGRDMSASNVSADSAEAGLFQQSYNSFSASPEMANLMAAYQANPSWGFQGIFREGLSVGMTPNTGSGAGAEFQRLCKISPAFAVECAAVGLRVIRKHWGPINRKEVELLSAADALFTQVQHIVDQQKGTQPVTDTSPPGTVPAQVGSPLASKVNWTALLQLIAGMLTVFSGGKLNITPEQQVAILGFITAVGPIATMMFRTFGTTTIMPQSLPKSMRP